MEKVRYKLQDAVDQVMNSPLYRSGEAFTISEMFDICTTVGYESRMSEVLRIMHEHGQVVSIGFKTTLMYRKPGENWMKKAFISEVAENLLMNRRQSMHSKGGGDGIGEHRNEECIKGCLFHAMQ